ncbi:MAG: crotonobetainyl-CoA:carnitine CoA-transferase CaiB-like acyl-CoA transferase [Acidimicrobiales bacterium]
MPPPLEGIRVLDLTQYLAGPHATMLLAGMGAEVIRIDNPHTGDALSGAPFFYGADGLSLVKRDDSDVGVAFLKRLRGKRSITLDLKSDEGRQLLLRLAEGADVLVENFAVGVTERLGIDWPTLQAVNPRLIYCAITGYGSTGPDRHRRGYDLTAQAMSGLMSVTGKPDDPPTKAGSPLADTVSAGFGFAGVLGALYQRERTGLGQFVDVAMTDVLFSLVFDDPLEKFDEIGIAQRPGNRVPRLSPFNTYRTSDGWMVICCGNDECWRRLCGVLGRLELAEHPQWGVMSWRIDNKDEVDAIVTTWTEMLTAGEAVERVLASGVAASAVHSIDDALEWPHLQERDMIEPVEHPTLGVLDGLKAAGFPLKFSGGETGYRHGAVVTGADTRRILGELGLSESDLDDLEARTII